MNVLAVKQGMNYATDWARNGKGPLVIELETYRYMGHSMSDPGLSYRSKEEVRQIQAEKDPIDRVKYMLIENNLATEDDLKNIEKEVRNEVDEAVQFAKDSPFPEAHDLYTDVLEDKPYYVRAVELQNSLVIQ